MFIITILGLTGIVAAPLYLRLIPEEYKASVLMFICGCVFFWVPGHTPGNVIKYISNLSPRRNLPDHHHLVFPNCGNTFYGVERNPFCLYKD